MTTMLTPDDHQLPLHEYRRSTLTPDDVAKAEAQLPPWTRELLPCLSARARTAFVLQQFGATQVQIGLFLRISSSRVSQLCAAAERRMIAAARRGAVLPRQATPFASHRCSEAEACTVPLHLRSALDLPIDSLDLSVRTYSCLYNIGARQLGQVVGLTEAKVLRTKNLGPRTRREITAALARLGLHLGMDVADWQPTATD